MLLIFSLRSYITRQAQHNHPYLSNCYLHQATPAEIPRPIIPQHAHFSPHTALVPANPYLLEVVPEWLEFYAKCNTNFQFICIVITLDSFL